MMRALPVLCLLTASCASAESSCPPYKAGQSETWAKGSVFYQVFVRSYFDSNGDGIGDFNGLTSRLDYLNDGNPATTTDLGVTALWLMPIAQSPSYHGYDTVDYDHVESDYGTDADFDKFLVEAHRRGIRVIIDLVVNHCSSQHPWFVEAASSVSSPHHDWFVWRPDDPGWTQPWSNNSTWHFVSALSLYYYGLFWSGMPDLNYENPAVRKEMEAIAKRWLRRGVDGFRLDASRHIIEAGSKDKIAGSPETHAWWREFASKLHEEFPQALLVGENWTSIDEVAEYFGSAPREELDLSFDFDLSAAFIASLNSGNAVQLGDTLCQVSTHYPAYALDATFLTNHDMIRVMTQILGDGEKARLGASLLLTLPGAPFIYYGEELGMKNGPGGADEEKRTPLQWTAKGGFTTGTPWRNYQDDLSTVNVEAEGADPTSLLNHYRKMVRLRLDHPALAKGTFTSRKVSGADGDEVLAFERAEGAEKLLVLANLGGREIQALTLDPPAGAITRAIFPAGAATTVGPLAARSLVVYQLGP